MFRSLRSLGLACASVSLVAVSSFLLAAEAPPAVPRFSVAHLDKSVDPGMDFFQFATGTWRKNNPVPADKSRWGGFDELAERNWGHVRALVEAAAANPGAAGSNTQKVGDLFASALDVAMINARGLQPIEPMLARIAAVTTREDLAAICAEMHLELGNPLLGMAFYADQKKSDTYAFYLGQGGLSLPSRDYYFSEKFARERWEFLGHVARMLELAGEKRETAYRQA